MDREILLSLDQSTRISGYAVFEGQSLIASGTFTFSDGDLGVRLVQIREKIQSLIKEYSVTKVAFEDIQLQSSVNPATYKSLAEVFGVVQELMTEIGMPYEVVHSQSWKSTLGIKGRARAEQKKNAQKYVAMTYGKDVSQDESDAICIGSHVLKELESAF